MHMQKVYTQSDQRHTTVDVSERKSSDEADQGHLNIFQYVQAAMYRP